MGSQWQAMHRMFWDGGSSFDAWLNLSSSKIAEILLAIPFAWAHAGLPSALIIQLLHFLIGWWSGCMIHLLYLKHISLTGRRDNYTVQLHEVLGGFMRRKWKLVPLLLNLGLLFTIATAQLLSCSNIIYSMDKRFEKRTWTLIFGAMFFCSILIPSAQNYRALSFIGVISTIYTAVYLVIVGASHEKVRNVHRPLVPQSFSQYFVSMSFFISLGSHGVPVEIMDAMWKPQNFRATWCYSMLYAAIVALLPTMSIFLRFGDRLLLQPNALATLPKTMFRDVAIVLLLIHQFIIFGIYALPVYMIFEKLFRVHDALSFSKKIVVRIPVFLLIWLAALALPFFWLANGPLPPFLVTWNLHILPCGLYVLTFWRDASSSEKAEEKPFLLLSWKAIFSINLGVVLWMIAMSGVCLWANIEAFKKQAKFFDVFAKCYYCT